MEITQAYAIAVSGTFLVLFLANYHRFIRHWIHAIRLFLSKVSYIRALRRFKRIGPWHLNTALLLAIFVIVNVYLTLFRGLFQPVSAKEVSVKAANLTLINLVPVIAGPSQSFLASIFSTSLKTFQKVHRSLALMSLLLSIFHVVAAIISMRSFSLNVISNRWAIALCLLIYRNAARPPKEKAFKEADVPGAGEGEAIITSLKDVEFDEGRLKKEICLNDDIVQVILELPRPLRVEAGQYIGLWIPAVGKFSFLQVHPFMVTSWGEGETNRLRLFVEPRNGWTKKLLRYTRIHRDGTPCRALFTGPYGISIPTRDCGILLLVASGLGIVAQIPYLKRRSRAHRIHLVSLLTCSDLAFIFEDILNEALAEDTLENGRILNISIFVESGTADQVPFGRRATVYSGLADLQEIIQSERDADTNGKREEMLVLISGSKGVRDELCKIARGHVYDKVSLVKLEYQPD
ncbi:ferric reductase [Diplogelasinospora grovesii]|uniref:ferric-chelate reductase (NADPH) n=1 Tax=Diplogelasinospora grovesii TaxID=303347 RepID=A0AAN6NCV2_9PEZI|nr:ferric reductase [Diplogelasinospora grovesii]